ncbi:MAG: hypothetical protein ACI4LB_08620 [Candidatus Fimenecus sp.]
MSEKLFTAVSVNGGGVYNKKKERFTVSYYKKKQMDELYPAGGFSVVGQIGKGREEIGTVTCGEGKLPVYAVSKMPHAKILGYIQVGENEYLSIVKDVLLLWLLWILLAAALLVGLAFLLKAVLPTNAEPETTTRAPGVIDANAVLGEGELSIPEKIDTSGRNITVNGAPEMHLVAGQREQNYVFSNPESNPCFFVIEMELADTGEIIYTSNLLPPGYSISKFTLNRPLEEGTYNVILHYKPTSFDQEQRPLNNMDIKTTVIAEAPAE